MSIYLFMVSKMTPFNCTTLIFKVLYSFPIYLLNISVELNDVFHGVVTMRYSITYLFSSGKFTVNSVNFLLLLNCFVSLVTPAMPTFEKNVSLHQLNLIILTSRVCTAQKNSQPRNY